MLLMPFYADHVLDEDRYKTIRFLQVHNLLLFLFLWEELNDCEQKKSGTEE
jgi:hypothetical protein